MANILLAECGTTPIQKVGEILVYEFIKRQLEQSNGQKKKKKKKKKKTSSMILSGSCLNLVAQS